MKALYSILLATIISATLFTGCSKKDDDKKPAPTHKVNYIVTGGSNAQVSVVVYTNALNGTSTITDINANSWSSGEFVMPAETVAVVFAASGSSTNGQPASFKVQIAVDGVVKKESTGSGTILSASASYTF